MTTLPANRGRDPALRSYSGRVNPGVGSVSPHLDDLALSCSTFLAGHPGSVMVTVFAGGPTSVDPLPGWDRGCLVFEPGDDVVGARRDEDRRAAKVLHASTRHLDHWDYQYRDPTYGYEGPTSGLAAAVAADLRSLVGELAVDQWLVPLGILHPDHQVTAEACLLAAGRRSNVEWLVYEELPYATVYPEERRIAMDALRHHGFSLEQLATPCASEGQAAKRSAIECYASQMPALAGGVDQAVATQERIHRLVPRR